MWRQIAEPASLVERKRTRVPNSDEAGATCVRRHRATLFHDRIEEAEGRVTQLFGQGRSLLRRRDAERRVEPADLFFDLVFVFVFTQLSGYLLHHTFPGAVAQAGLLLCGVWRVWVDTAWCTNLLDPRRAAVRAMVLALTLAGIVLAASIPDAFGARGASFAGAYVLMQLGRTGFMAWSLRGSPGLRRFAWVAAWLSVSGVLWVAGGLTIGVEKRFMFWLVAIAIEYLPPASGFREPAPEEESAADALLAERCHLFVVIALAQALFVAGASFADLAWTSGSIAAFAVVFAGLAAMWWIQIGPGTGRAGRRAGARANAGRARAARAARVHAPLVILAGVVVVAVGNEMMLADPFRQEEGLAALGAIVGGAALYLLGNGLSTASALGRWPSSHLAGLGLLAAAFLIGLGAAPLPLGVAASAILAVVALWDAAALRLLRGAG